jgi:phosphoserine phosphatase RsbX
MIHAVHVSLPKVGETENGDAALFRQDEVARSLLVVVDALGHGPGAAAVSRVALEFLNSVPLDIALLELMQLLHGKLAGSRGAGATICLVREGKVEACAVGNVELRCSEIRIPLVFTAGVLGGRVARFHVCQAPLRPRARVVLFSDGISSRTPVDEMRKLAPKAACDAIMSKYRRKEDDATVLVADVE